MSSSPSSIRLASAIFIAMATVSQAALVLNENFSDGYVAGNLASQNATGAGLSGTWGDGGTGIEISYQAAGLSMVGVQSSGGSVIQTTATGNANSRTLTAAFSSALPAQQLYGSYLFTTTTHTDSRSLGVVFMGPSGSNDGTNAANQGGFTWASNTFNNLSGNSGHEGPGVRAGGSGWQNPGVTLTSGETYLMLFTFDASTDLTSAWVLNQAQLTNYLALGQLDAASLDAAGLGVGDDQVVWSGDATAANGIGALSHLKLIGIGRSNNSTSVWDELRISDSSLFEAVTAVPEPSALALGLVSGLFALRRRRA